MIYSYDFQNAVRDVTPAIEKLKQDEPTLLSITQFGNPVTNRSAEWIDKVLGVKYVDVLSGTATTVQLEAGKGELFEVGMEISPVDTADNYIVTAIDQDELTISKAVSGMADPISGSYSVSLPAVVEGSVDGSEIFFEGAPKLNNTQIFRAEAKLTRTAMGTSTYDNANNMNEQVEAAMFDIYHAMNNALWRGRKKLGSATVPGKMGGLYEFCTANIVDANGGVISLALINQLLEKIHNVGGNPDTLICHPSKIAKINEIYKDYLKIDRGDGVVGRFVYAVVDPYSGAQIRIIADKSCPGKDIWLIEAGKIELDPFINGTLVDFDSSAAGFDGAKRTVLGEYTAKFHNATECFGHITNLG